MAKLSKEQAYIDLKNTWDRYRIVTDVNFTSVVSQSKGVKICAVKAIIGCEICPYELAKTNDYLLAFSSSSTREAA